MKRILVISNRLPLTVTKRENKLRFHPSVGGLATGLSSLARSYDNIWIGWPGLALERIEEERKLITRKLKQENCHPVFIKQTDMENYYYGFCNRTIWPLFHYFTQYSMYSRKTWNSYLRVNQIFCSEIVRIAKPDDIIWVHDYHLMLLPNLIRKKMPQATIGFFLHIPFPSSEVFRILPPRKEIVRGVLGADLIGFHTYDYAHHFIETTRRLLGYEHSKAQINIDNRLVKIDAFPMGIDFDAFNRAGDDSNVQREIKKIRKRVGERKIIISIDRLDYTKGIAQRLEAFDHFLETSPKYRGKVTLILVAVPSRTGVEQYSILKREVDELISRINGKYGTIGWMPIWYLYRFLSFKNLVPLYNVGDVALVTPMRDGMNLIAKEYLATKKDKKGVLILSEMAGASKVLGEAIIVNPNNKEEMAAAIRTALQMSESEQIRRNEVMRKRLKRYDVERWAHDFIDVLSRTKQKQSEVISKNLTPSILRTMIKDCRARKRRLLLLDYDGTLVPFVSEPSKAAPDPEILDVIKRLCMKTRNTVIIVSGRDRQTLDRWFGKLKLGMIAEHGVWYKEKSADWKMLKQLKSEWKEQIRQILELQVDRTPGSRIEEKEFSLVWHYRKTDERLGERRASDLKERLIDIATQMNLSILEGSKVVEVKNSGVNKGTAVRRWLDKQEHDFILAIGDDWTDEDTFEAVTESAYSIKVGIGFTKARYTIPSPGDARNLLKKIAKC